MGIVYKFPVMARPDKPHPNRIREHRRAAGMTLVQLGEKIGATATQISRFETGERDLTTTWERKIARALNVSRADLLAIDDHPYMLDERERAVIDAMRAGGETVAEPISRVAESLSTYRDERKSA